MAKARCCRLTAHASLHSACSRKRVALAALRVPPLAGSSTAQQKEAARFATQSAALPYRLAACRCAPYRTAMPPRKTRASAARQQCKSRACRSIARDSVRSATRRGS
ncbi:hypothetical protein NPIL_369551 [Nephila pilipes]|uniref:Uncharacterized protein n=1 Tax=Nephila pilipes TaxID=299642 RepID=A0A8X6QYQ8_NEPPI|nr:hypothetical protein NPIL_369551 [Nephila pilipes]